MAGPDDQLEKKRRRQRNIAIALLLATFIAIVYFVTIFRIGGNIDQTYR